MGLMNYLPTGQLMSLLGLTEMSYIAKEHMKIKTMDHYGNPCTIMGISEFVLQTNPAKIPEPSYTVDYLRMEALGLMKPTLHYTGGKYEPIDLSFVVTDSFDGPPHATTDYEGNIIYNTFADLWEVRDWLYALKNPMLGWNKPPYVRFQLGGYMKTGVITKISCNIVKMYENAMPMIMECSLTLQPDVIMVTSTQTYGLEES